MNTDPEARLAAAEQALEQLGHDFRSYSQDATRDYDSLKKYTKALEKRIIDLE